MEQGDNIFLLIIQMDELTELYTLPREPKGHGSQAGSGPAGRLPPSTVPPLCPLLPLA